MLFVLLFDSNLVASTGCLKGGLVYTSPPSGWNQWTNSIDDSCPNGALVSDTYAYINSTSGTSCSVGFLGWSGSGVLVDYSIMNCPIDGYIPFVMMIASFTAVVFLKRNQLSS